MHNDIEDYPVIDEDYPVIDLEPLPQPLPRDEYMPAKLLGASGVLLTAAGVAFSRLPSTDTLAPPGTITIDMMVDSITKGFLTSGVVLGLFSAVSLRLAWHRGHRR